MTLDNLKEAHERGGDQIVAIYPVHIGGHCADMKALSDYARRQGWKIVEDACHALGGTNQGYPVGACGYSDMACFSLHATKSFTGAEGGVVTTNDAELADRMRRLRNHGMVRDEKTGPWAYEMTELGYNYRMTDVQAALAIKQIARLDTVRKRRGEIAGLYRSAFEQLSNSVKPVAPSGNGQPLLHLFQLLVNFSELGLSRDNICRQLLDKGVGTQVHYIPVAAQPYYLDLYGEQDLPGAHSFYDQVLALPYYSSLTDEEVEEVIQAVKSVLGLN
jgi:dTDP-4-amino-4,6-dideoxygalactose transaminase